jgi:streptogramin lyase
MKTKIIFVFTVTLILCLVLIQGSAWGEPAFDSGDIPQPVVSEVELSTFHNPPSDVWRWQLGPQEVTLSAPQGVSFASPVYWEDAGSQPTIWTQSSGPDSPVEVFIEPSPDAQVKVIVQLDGEPVLAARQRLRQEERLTASSLQHQRAELLAAQTRFLDGLRAAGIQAQVGHQYTSLIHGLALTLPQVDVGRLSEMPGVRGVFPDYRVHALQPPNVTQIGAPTVWAMTDPYGQPVRGDGMRVAVLDTGIDYTHPDMGGGGFPNDKVIGGYNFVNPGDPPFDDHGHGTHAAGIIAADGVLLGVAPDAQLLAYKVLDEYGSGEGSDIIAALEMAVDPDGDPLTDDGAHVINLSFGGPGSPFDPVSQAVDAAVEAGAVVAAAAGNSGRDGWQTVESPGTAAQAITVGAVDGEDAQAEFSSLGPVPQNWTIKPDLLAPGVEISSTVPASGPISDPTGYLPLDGTSMATPHVAGAAALLRQLHPDWTPDQVKGALMGAALDLDLSAFAQGAGRAQVDQAATAPAAFTPSSISLGLDDLTQSLWSPSHILHLTNLMTEVTTYTLRLEGDLPDGVDALFQPAVLILDPGETEDFLFTMTVDNGRVPNADEPPYAYQGWLVAEGGSQDVRAPLAFIKSPLLWIEFDTPPDYMVIHDGDQHFWWGSPEWDEEQSPMELLVPAGTYEVAAIWWKFSVHGVVRDGVTVETVTPVRLDPAQAIHRFEIKPTGIAGDPVPLNWNFFGFSIPQLGLSWSGTGGYDDDAPSTAYFSDMSSDYWWDQALVSWGEERDTYIFKGSFRGIWEDIQIENPPENLVLMRYILRLRPEADQPMLIEGICDFMPTGGHGCLRSRLGAQPGMVRQVYHAPWPVYDSLFGLTSWTLEAPEMVFATPYYTSQSPGSVVALDRDDPTVTMADIPAGTTPLGLGPAVWRAGFENETGMIRLRSLHGRYQWSHPKTLNLWPFMGPVGDHFHPKGLPYRIEQNGQVLLEGEFPSRQWTESWGADTLEIPLPITVTGQISFHTSLDYTLGQDAVSGLAQVTAAFDPALEDPNPPALTAFQILADGRPTDEAEGPVVVRFTLTDTMRVESVLLEADFGEGYTPYPLESDFDDYSVALPAGRRWSQVTLRLTAEDISGNRLVYEADPAYVVPPVRLYFPLVAKGYTPSPEPTLAGYDLPDPISSPEFIAVGGQGEIWFTEAGINRIGCLVPADEQITEWMVPMADSGPAGIALDAEGMVWFAESWGGKIGRLDPTTNAATRVAEAQELGPPVPRTYEVTEWPLPDSTLYPSALTAAPDGTLWLLAEAENDDVVGQFDPASETFRIWTLPTSSGGPKRLALDDEGNVWFTATPGPPDFFINRLARLDPQDNLLTEWDLPVVNAVPWGIGIGPSGEVWLTQFETGVVGRFIPETRDYTIFWVPSLNSKPAELAVAGEQIWFTEFLGSQVMLLDPAQTSGQTANLGAGTEDMVSKEQAATGQMTEIQAEVTEASPRTTFVVTQQEEGFTKYLLPDAGSQPGGIVLGEEGVWFTESGAGRIAHLVPMP